MRAAKERVEKTISSLWKVKVGINRAQYLCQGVNAI